MSNNNFFLFFRFLLLFKDAEFFPPLKIGHEIVAFNISLSRSPILELISSDFELLKDKDAEGDRSDLAIVTSFSDCSYSSLEIIKFGLFILDISIASFKPAGITKLKSDSLSKEFTSTIGPIIFSYVNLAVTVSFFACKNFACAPASDDSD